MSWPSSSQAQLYFWISTASTWKSENLPDHRKRSKKGSESHSWLPEGIDPESFEFCIHLGKSEKERKSLKDEEQLSATSISLPLLSSSFTLFWHNDFHVLKRALYCIVLSFLLAYNPTRRIYISMTSVHPQPVARQLGAIVSIQLKVNTFIYNHFKQHITKKAI